MAQILRADTEIKVRVGPFVDVGDGFTPQTDIALSGNEAELLKAGGVATVDISGRTWAAITSVRGWYDLTLTTDDTNTEGDLTVVVQDDSDCLPVMRYFQVITADAYDFMYASTSAPDTDVAAILADTGELQADDTPAALATLSGKVDTIDGIVDNILTDTGTTLENRLIAIEADTDVIDDGTSGLVKIASDVAEILTDTSTTLQAELDGIQAVTDALPDAGALTTIGTDTARLTAVRAAALTDWINGERLDLILDSILALLDDARGEPAQGEPPVNPDAMTKIDWLYKSWRNLKTQTATDWNLYNDAGAVIDSKATVSDDGTTATKTQIVTGP